MKMKRVFYAIVAIVFLQFSCTNSDLEVQTKSDNLKNKKSARESFYQCGATWGDNHYGVGSYNYGNYVIDLSNVREGTVIQIKCTNYDVPNRFNVARPDGSGFQSTGWFGVSSTSGPWGYSINNAGFRILTITKQSATDNTYYLSVETFSQTYMNDAWEVNLGCSHPGGCCYCL
jgi:hypothetical protein